MTPLRGARALVGLGMTALLGLAAACTGGSLPPIHYYTLRSPGDAVEPPGRGEARDGLLVGVDSIAVDPPYDQDRIVYRSGRDSAEVGFYSYHRWASPLGRLLQVALADTLDGATGLGVIEPVRSGRDYDARLGGRLMVLEEIDSANVQEVRLVLELVLRDRAGATLWSSIERATVGGRTDKVGEVVAMAERALDEVLERTAGQIEAALAAAESATR